MLGLVAQWIARLIPNKRLNMPIRGIPVGQCLDNMRRSRVRTSPGSWMVFFYAFCHDRHYPHSGLSKYERVY